MIEITEKPISPEEIIHHIKTAGSGCVVTYVGLIRDNSNDKLVKSVEYSDPDGSAGNILRQISLETSQKWIIENIAICHRIGKLLVGDINLVVAISAAHRAEGFAACQYVIDEFKNRLPTRKKELYL